MILILISCQGEGKNDIKTDCQLTITLNRVTIDHVLELREDCRITRVKLLVDIHNPTKDPIKLNEGQKKYFCFWNDLKPIFILENPANKSDSLYLGLPDEYLIKPNSNTLIECVVLNKHFAGSLNSIHTEILNWLNGDFYFSESTFKKQKYFLKTIEKNKYKKTFILDDNVINPTDSIGTNKQYEMSSEEIKNLLKN